MTDVLELEHLQHLVKAPEPRNFRSPTAGTCTSPPTDGVLRPAHEALHFQCCLIHLKNSSICHRDLYISAIVWANVVLLVTNT